MNSSRRMTIAAAVTLTLVVCASLGTARGEGDELAAKVRAMPVEERVDYLRSLLAEGQRDPRIHFQLGNAFYAMGQMDSATASFYRATQIDTNYSRAWVNLGIAYDEQHQFSAARQAYKAAIKADPQDVLAYCHLGQNHFERKEVDEAIKLYVKALAIDPNSAQAHYNLGLAFAESKVFAEALLEWRRVVELDPGGDLGRVAAENISLIETYLELEQ